MISIQQIPAWPTDRLEKQLAAAMGRTRTNGEKIPDRSADSRYGRSEGEVEFGWVGGIDGVPGGNEVV